MNKNQKSVLLVIVAWILTISCFTFYISDTNPHFHNQNTESQSVSNNAEPFFGSGFQATKTDLTSIQLVRLGIVSCGDRMSEALTLTKSAIISALRFKLQSLEIIYFADDESLLGLDIELNVLKDKIPDSLNFKYEIHPLVFPPMENEDEWVNLFRPCATQRLFFPSALPHIDELIYLDTDVLVLEDLREIWSYFSKMNLSQHTALAPEHESHAIGWYNRFARHHPPLGVNSGVMLMNLTKLRKFGWEEKAVIYYEEYKNVLEYGDQDIINIIFHYYPAEPVDENKINCTKPTENLYVLPCAFNYRSDHCIYGRGGPSAENSSIRLIHGNRQVFHESSELMVFKIIYSFFERFNLSKDHVVTKNDLKTLEIGLDVLNSEGRGGCDGISRLVLKQQ